jgi:membrane glycosyltransferase
MGSSDGHDRLTTDEPHHLRRYLIRAAKVYLSVSAWFGIFALLLAYGPPAMSVANGATYPAGIVTWVFAVLLSGGAATVLTIILGVFVLSAIGWNRNQSAESQDDTETMEDESHA